jgi:hypothetical protein
LCHFHSVYEIEKASKTPDRFRFPCFETLHWLVADRIVQDLHDMNGKGVRCPEYLINGARALQAALKSWTMEKENGKGRPAALENVPECVVVPKLLRDLNREIRAAERHGNPTVSAPSTVSSVASSPAAALLVATTKPPGAVVKKERETPQRIRKKPKARADFVDINEALSNFAAEEVSFTFQPFLHTVDSFISMCIGAPNENIQNQDGRVEVVERITSA